MLTEFMRPDVEELIETKNLDALREAISEWQPADLAALMADLPNHQKIFVFQAVPPARDAATFEYLDLATQESLIRTLPSEEIASVLNGMAPDDRTALLTALPPPTITTLLTYLQPEQLAVTHMLLGYPERSVGRFMTPDYIAVQEHWSVKQVLDDIRSHGKSKETLNMIYVIDDGGKLIDDIQTYDLLLTPLHTTVIELMDRRFVALVVTHDKTTAIDLFKKYDRVALPVVDADGILVGVVTVDDVMDIAEQRATKQIQEFGGMEALDEPYVATPLFTLVRKRAVWLVILFVGEMLTATAMGAFEDEIAKAVVLALFVPLIISSGGNSGSQAATLVIRALALGEVRLRDWWMVMRREFFSGLMLGGILGMIGFLRIAIWHMFSDIYGPHWLLVALTVSFSLIGIVTWGTLAGSMLPFILRRLGADPAKSSAPFVATLVDVTGLIIYFSVASLILGRTLLR